MSFHFIFKDLVDWKRVNAIPRFGLSSESKLFVPIEFCFHIFLCLILQKSQLYFCHLSVVCTLYFLYLPLEIFDFDISRCLLRFFDCYFIIIKFALGFIAFFILPQWYEAFLHKEKSTKNIKFLLQTYMVTATIYIVFFIIKCLL